MIEYKVDEIRYEEMITLQEANNIRNEMTEDRFNWLYYKNPFGNSYFYCAYDDGRLVGTQVSLPLTMQVNGETVNTVMSMNSLIDSSCRGKGVWKKLINMNHEDQAERGTAYIWGFPNDASYPIFINKVGWKDICYVNYYRCVLKDSETGSIGRRVAEKGIGLVTRTTTGGRRKRLSIELADFDLDAIRAKDDEISVLQSVEYVKWRFIDIPEGGYALKTIRRGRGGDPVGFVAYKVRDGIMHVFDYRISDKTLEKEIPFLLQAEALDRDFRRIDICLSTSTGAIPHFEAAKFIKREGAVTGGRVFDLTYANAFDQPWSINMADLDIYFNKPFE